MARRSRKVTWLEADLERIPDAQRQGVMLVLDLKGRGRLADVAERFLIRRQGGYCGFDILLLLLLFFSDGTATGIGEFWQRVRDWSRKLAAAAGRKSLASCSSVSRALDEVELHLLRPAAEWLLSLGSDIDGLLRHPSVQTYDARGEGWHVFDFDPTVTTLRHRALPVGEDLPEPRRRSKRTAAPGYAGRKRGNVQIRRGTLQHAGSGAWLQAMLGPGNSDSHAELGAALDVVVRTCQRLDHPLERVVFLMDGGFAGVPYLAESRARGVGVITRLVRPLMFKQPEVLDALRNGKWHFVPDSRSGPRRSALDLGLVTIFPDKDSRRPDGTPYEPIDVRVVVSRYPRTGKAKQGVVLDGWQYEPFVADVPAEALPAPEAVSLFFGRARQENRFAQEDREIGLDHIFSYHLPGQEFAVVVGLWLWNLRLARGFELEPPPMQRPQQKPYVEEVDQRTVPAGAAPLAQHTPDREPGLPEQPSPDLEAPDIEGSSPGMPEDASSGPLHATAPGPAHLLAQLRRVDWNHALRNRMGWSWDATTGHLLCAAGRQLALSTVSRAEYAPSRTAIVFCRPAGGCEACGFRPNCLRSADPRRAKHAQVPVLSGIAVQLRRLLAARRLAAKDPPPAPGPTAARPPAPQKAPPLAPKTAHRPLEFRQPPTAVPAPERLLVLSSLFLPAVARHILRTAVQGSTISVSVHEPPPSPPAPLLLALSVADRQHCRKTWQENFERYALPPDVQVDVAIAGGATLRRLLDAR